MMFLRDDKRNVNGKFYCEIYDDSILHFRAGSNWTGLDQSTYILLCKQLKECLNAHKH